MLAAGCVLLALVIAQGWGDAACLVSAALLVGVGLACRQAAHTELVYRFRDSVPVWNPPGKAVDSNVDR